MIRLVADTHAVLWYLYGDARLSPTARKAFDAAAPDAAAVSTITLVEIRYLEEKGRLDAGAYAATRAILRDPASPFVVAPLTAEVVDALARVARIEVARRSARFARSIDALARVARIEVPDLPDRVIAATAVCLGVPLVTRDARIVASQVPTVW